MQVQRLRLNALSNKQDAMELGRAFENLFRTQALNSGNLRIQGGSAAPTWQTQNAIIYTIEGVTYSLAAQSSQAVPSAITWTAVASTFQAGAFLITADAGGTVRTIPTNVGTGTSAALALQGIVWPPVPIGQVVTGIVIIANSAANTAFTAATTNLDAANISTTFINVSEPFFPTAPY